MPRPEGLPKTGGRKRGTPNKKTAVLQDALKFHKIDVVAELSELLPQLEPAKRADVLISLMAYLYPKRRSVELSAQDDSAQRPQVILCLPKNGREAEGTIYDEDPDDLI